MLALAALIIFIFECFIFKRKKPNPAALIPTTAFAVFALCFSEAWWARYASFIYYIPLFALTSLFADEERASVGKGSGALARIKRMLSLALCAAFIGNAGILIGAVAVNGAEMTSFINDKLDAVAAQNKKIILRVNDFTSHVKLFEERGIDFEISHTALENPEIFYLTTKYEYAE